MNWLRWVYCYFWPRGAERCGGRRAVSNRLYPATTTSIRALYSISVVDESIEVKDYSRDSDAVIRDGRKMS